MSDLKPVRKTIHMCVDIQGSLNRSDRELRGMYRADDGSTPSAREIREWLKLQLAQGKRVLPMDKPCEGWSDQTGCPGHVIEDKAADATAITTGQEETK